MAPPGPLGPSGCLSPQDVFVPSSTPVSPGLLERSLQVEAQTGAGTFRGHWMRLRGTEGHWEATGRHWGDTDRHWGTLGGIGGHQGDTGRHWGCLLPLLPLQEASTHGGCAQCPSPCLARGALRPWHCAQEERGDWHTSMVAWRQPRHCQAAKGSPLGRAAAKCHLAGTHAGREGPPGHLQGTLDGTGRKKTGVGMPRLRQCPCRAPNTPLPDGDAGGPSWHCRGGHAPFCPTGHAVPQSAQHWPGAKPPVRQVAGSKHGSVSSAMSHRQKPSHDLCALQVVKFEVFSRLLSKPPSGWQRQVCTKGSPEPAQEPQNHGILSDHGV